MYIDFYDVAALLNKCYNSIDKQTSNGVSQWS